MVSVTCNREVSVESNKLTDCFFVGEKYFKVFASELHSSVPCPLETS